uniref:(northern house mosquito) hypothetical protein n=1 Tax=Culex pipiens TaxID=7175 RepID=A0A8D8MTR8_CULPI
MLRAGDLLPGLFVLRVHHREADQGSPSPDRVLRWTADRRHRNAADGSVPKQGHRVRVQRHRRDRVRPAVHHAVSTAWPVPRQRTVQSESIEWWSGWQHCLGGQTGAEAWIGDGYCRGRGNDLRGADHRIAGNRVVHFVVRIYDGGCLRGGTVQLSVGHLGDAGRVHGSVGVRWICMIESSLFI